MRPEMRCLLRLELRHMCAAQHLPLESDLCSSDFSSPEFFSLSARCVEMKSTVRTSPEQKFSQVFGVFMPFACGFSCCRQQTVIPLKLPCVHVCVSLFFLGSGGGGGDWGGVAGKCRTACLCVYVCMRDVQRNAL